MKFFKVKVSQHHIEKNYQRYDITKGKILDEYEVKRLLLSYYGYPSRNNLFEEITNPKELILLNLK